MRPESNPVELTVATADLRAALRSLARAVPRRRHEEAVLSYDEANLHLELGGATLAIPAAGCCAAQIRVPGAMLLKLASVLPRGPRLTLSAAGTQLRVDRCALPCKLQASWSKLAELPANATPVEALRMLAGEPDAELDAAGLLGYVGAQRDKLRRRWRREGRDISDIEDLLGPLPGARQLDFFAMLEGR